MTGLLARLRCLLRGGHVWGLTHRDGQYRCAECPALMPRGTSS